MLTEAFLDTSPYDVTVFWLKGRLGIFVDEAAKLSVEYT